MAAATRHAAGRWQGTRAAELATRSEAPAARQGDGLLSVSVVSAAGEPTGGYGVARGIGDGSAYRAHSLDVPTALASVERHPLSRSATSGGTAPARPENETTGGRCWCFKRRKIIEDPKFPRNAFMATTRMGEPYLVAFNKAKSLNVFSIDNRFRRAMIHITTNEFFDYFIILTILVNCVFLAINSTYIEQELFFASIYTIEMMMKIVALGFFHHRLSYLRNPWNILDFLVVMLGWLPGIVNLSTLRAFRVFRVLRTINALPGLRIMVTAVLQSLRALGDVFLLMLFFLFVSAVLGVQLFSGSLLNKCVLPDPSADLTCAASNLSTCIADSAYSQNSSYWVMQDGSPIVCGNASTATSCPAPAVCLAGIGLNPNHGYTSFDHFGFAFLTSIQLFTLDFWENVYVLVLAAIGAPAVVYFYFVVFGGAFYTLNLVLAIVSMSYNKASLHDKEDTLADEMLFRENQGHPRRNQELTEAAEKAVVQHATDTVQKDRAKDAAAAGNAATSLVVPTSTPGPRAEARGESAPMLSVPAPNERSRLQLRPSDEQRPPMPNMLSQPRTLGPPPRRSSEPILGGLAPAPRAKFSGTGNIDRIDEARPPMRPANLAIPPVAALTSDRPKAVGVEVAGADHILSATGSPPKDINPAKATPPGLSTPSPSSVQALPSIASASPLPELRVRSSSLRLNPERAFSLPESDCPPMGAHHLPPITSTPSPGRTLLALGAASASTGEGVPPMIAPLPGTAVSSRVGNSGLTAVSLDEENEGDELGPLLVNSVPERNTAEKPQPARPRKSLSSLSLPLAPPPPPLFDRQTSKSSVSSSAHLFMSRQSSNRSSNTGSLSEFASRPAPLPPAVFVQDEEENMVEEVRVSSMQRITHHVDTICWPLARRTADIVRSSKFETFIIVCIMLNTVILAIERPFMDPDLAFGLCLANLVFGVVFLLEAVTKLLAYGPRLYFRQPWNILDCLIVLFSIVEFGLMMASGGVCNANASNIATIFRAFRLLRILKLAQSWSTMRSLLAIIGSSLKDLGYLTLVMVIVLVTFALVGMHLFRPFYTPAAFAPDGVPRWNFTDFGHSLMLIFRILCGEWIESLYDTMRVSHVAATLFYLIVLAVGNFLILNLFLALLLNSFDVENIRQEREEGAGPKVRSRLAQLKRLARRCLCCRRRSIAPRGGSRRKSRSRNTTISIHPDAADKPKVVEPASPSSSEPGTKLPSTHARKSNAVQRQQKEMAMGALVDFEQAAKAARRRTTSESSNTTMYLTENQEPAVCVSNDATTPSKRVLSISESSDGATAAATAAAAAAAASSSGGAGVPTVKLTQPNEPTEIGVCTVETERLDLEERTVQDGSVSHEHRLSVTHTRVRSSSTTSTSSDLSSAHALTPGQPSRDGSQVSLHSRLSIAASAVIAQGAGGKRPVSAAHAHAQGLTVADSETLKNNCCTCVSTHRCGCLWCLCACCFTRGGGAASSDDIEMVDLTPGVRDDDDAAAAAGNPRPSCTEVFKGCVLGVRSRVAAALAHQYFDNIILLLVIISSITLAFEDSNVESGSARDTLLQQLNIIFTSIFTAELLLKLVSWGPVRYFRNPWNWLDCIIVLISLASIDYTGSNARGQLSALKAIRTLRCLRPLRSISRWNGMKTVVNALLRSLPGISNVLLVCGIIWLIFSILGVQFFGGLFHKCELDGVRLNSTVVPNKNSCVVSYGQAAWVNSPQNFDNVINAALSLFQVATFEGWVELMADAVDAKGIDQQPVYEYNFAAYLYFVVFIVIGSFFVLNLFIGVIIDSFNSVKKQHEDQPTFAKFLTPNQQAWIRTWRKMANTKPPKSTKLPDGRIHRCMYKVVVDQRFEIVVMTIILLNAILIATEHYNQGNTWTLFQFYCNTVFTALYVFEAVLKIYVWRRAYFYSGWNIFDLIVIVLAIAGMLITLLAFSFPIDPSLLRLVRLVRVVRVLRVVRRAQGLRRLLFTLFYSLPALVNIGALLFLVIYIYSILGISIFGNVKYTGVLSEQVNFRDFPHAFLVLFRIATAAGWNDVLYGLMVSAPECDPNYQNLPMGNCGHAIIGPLYLGSFVMISYIIVVNMYIAIVLENFAETEEVGLGESDLEAFYETWARFDPGVTQFIPFFDIQRLIRVVPRPLGIPTADVDVIADLNIPLFKDDENDMMVAHCLDVMDALVRRVLTKALGNIDDSSHIAELMQQTQEKFNEKFPSRTKSKPVSNSTELVRATLSLQKAVRRFLRAKQLRKQQRTIPEGEVLIGVADIQQQQHTIPEHEVLIDVTEVREEVVVESDGVSSTSSTLLVTASASRPAIFQFAVSPDDHHIATPADASPTERRHRLPAAGLAVEPGGIMSRSTPVCHQLSPQQQPQGSLLAQREASRSIQSVNLVGRAADIVSQGYAMTTKEIFLKRASVAGPPVPRPPSGNADMPSPRQRRQTYAGLDVAETRSKTFTLPRSASTDRAGSIEPAAVTLSKKPPLRRNSSNASMPQVTVTALDTPNPLAETQDAAPKIAVNSPRSHSDALPELA